MKALVKTKRDVGCMELLDVPIPHCGADEVLIRIHAIGICGSDLHIVYNAVPYNPPVIMGHEFSGEIIEAGSQVTRFKAGDRVVAENVESGCGECEACRTGHHCICSTRNAKGINSDGAMAEYIVCKERNVFHLPDSITYDQAALMEPLTVCCHGVFEQSKISAGDIVLVSGPGTIGLLAALLAKIAGATVILTGLKADESRLKLAEDLGIDYVVILENDDVDSLVSELTRDKGVDVVLECSGAAPALQNAVRLVKMRGTITLFGLFGKEAAINWNYVVTKELEVRGTLSHTYTAWQRAIQLLEKHMIPIEKLIMHEFSLANWEQAFKVVESKEGIKVIFHP